MIKYFDIFAGIGGFRSGLEKAVGFECVGYCEIDRRQGIRTRYQLQEIQAGREYFGRDRKTEYRC
ncbi:MAG: DNA cytosine methyltransferase [Ruminococcus sp.]|uniref:DNA cytosine methyltransferase n=1 Tax=Ruminococcus TaxID=1263 RepID=UPI0039A357A1